MIDINPQSACWLYLRKSRAEEAEERASKRDVLSSHRSRLIELAARDGITFLPQNVFAEIGSGDEISTRPEFVRLLGLWQRLPRNHGGVVYCTEISRLSRGLQSQQGLVQDVLSRAGVLIRTPNRYYDLREPEDAFLFEAEGLIARSELRHYKQRTAAARDELTRQGRPLTGRPPFGYRWDKNRETFIPTDDFPVLQAFLRDLLRMSIPRTSAKYGVPKHIIYNSAINPVVCGWAVRRHGRHHGEKPWAFPYADLPRDQWVWPENAGNWPPAISREEWEELQAVLNRRWVKREKIGSDEGWCRDVIQFRGLPGRVRLGSAAGSRGNYLTYDLVTPDGKVLYIARDAVHSAAEELLEAALGPNSRVHEAIAIIGQQQTLGPTESAPEATEIERRLARLRAQLDNLTLRLADPDMDPEQMASLARVEKQVTAQLKAEREALQKAQAAEAAAPHLESLLEELPALHEDFAAAWAELDSYTRRRLTKNAIALIEVTAEPKPGSYRWRREVTACVPMAWLKNLMGTAWGTSVSDRQSQYWRSLPERMPTDRFAA